MSSEETAGELAYVKGHGTGNDFVLFADPDGTLDLTPALVAAVCDRRTGVGGDGVLRVVRTVHATEPYVLAQADTAEWFMDYRNADGSVAEMCGNGVRVFVRYLLDAGLLDAASELVSVATRSGVVPVRVEGDGMLAADLGPAVVLEIWPAPVVHIAEVGGRVDPTAEPEVDGVLGDGHAGDPGWAATGVALPNPHAVVFVDDVAAAGDLVHAPQVTPPEAYPDGVNVEFVAIEKPGELRMRVWERGVGETASCGTGACAAVVAARRRLATGTGGLDHVPAQWTVDVPGGRLRVTEHPEGTVELAGPAVLVSNGVLREDWLAAVRGAL